tara:strand:+ start:49 stop:750 length:702 start_codon:yes stop_codon:yes gene_type:complete
MKSKNFKLGLYGKKYIDKMYYFDDFRLSETNFAKKISYSEGGIYNFKKINNNKLKLYFFEDGHRTVKIINDKKTSTRTSILDQIISDNYSKINYAKLDWLHVSYLDDIEHKHNITFECPTSVDFCNTENRENYSKIIDRCSLVFDSRERKSIYKNLNTNTPIILHDPLGCECIINNKIKYSFSSKKVKNLYVNGAGDIFCGIFLLHYYNLGIQAAIEKSCFETTKNLIKINEI